MNNKNKILAALIFVQIIILSIVYMKDDGSAVSSKNIGNHLLKFSRQSFHEIEIISEGQTLNLIHQDSEWKLRDFYSFPANQKKVDQFIQNIKDIRIGYPVGKTEIAAKQFRTSMTDFERRIIFRKGDKIVKSFYLGSSPSFKKVYARVHDSDLTYAIQYSSYEASVNPKDWIDTELYYLDENEVSEVISPNFSLINEGSIFSIKGLSENLSPNPDEIKKTLSKFLRIPFLEILGDKKRDEPGYGKVVFNFQVKYQAGNSIAYNLTGPMKEKGDYILKVSNLPYYFKVERNRINDLKTLTIDDLTDEMIN